MGEPHAWNIRINTSEECWARDDLPSASPIYPRQHAVRHKHTHVLSDRTINISPPARLGAKEGAGQSSMNQYITPKRGTLRSHLTFRQRKRARCVVPLHSPTLTYCPHITQIPVRDPWVYSSSSSHPASTPPPYPLPPHTKFSGENN